MGTDCVVSSAVLKCEVIVIAMLECRGRRSPAGDDDGDWT